MLTINIPETEYYDGATDTFINCPAKVLNLEHSLIAISKWESKWMKPFLGKQSKTSDEIYHYIQCMSIDQAIDMFTIKNLNAHNIEIITNYIQSPMSATTIKDSVSGKAPSREVITSELIYYWMVAHNIPFECQHWHLNRLLTLIGICNVKNSPPKKQSSKEILSKNAALNAARKKAMKTSG